MNICCSICMDSYIQADDVRITACGHLFHFCCLTGWLSGAEREPTCPQCRKIIQVKSLQKVFFNQADDIEQLLKCKCKEYQMQIELLKDDLERINQMYKQLESILFEDKDVEKGLRKGDAKPQTGIGRTKTEPSKNKTDETLGSNTIKKKSSKIAALRKNFEAMGRLPISVKPPENEPTAPQLNVVNEREMRPETEKRNQEDALRSKLNVAEQRVKAAERHLEERNRNDESRIQARVEEELAKAKVLQEAAKLQQNNGVPYVNEVEAFIKTRLEAAERRIMAADAHAKAAEQRARALEQRVQAQLRAANQRALCAEQRAITAEQVIIAQQRKAAVFHFR